MIGTPKDTLDGVEARLLSQMPADVQDHAETMDLLDEEAPCAGKTDVVIDAAATEHVGGLVGDAQDPQAELVARP